MGGSLRRRFGRGITNEPEQRFCGCCGSFLAFMPRILLLTVALLSGVVGCSRTSSRAETEASLPELNRALQMWVMGHGSVPSDLSQLTNIPTLKGKRLPAPPPGKKLAFDPGTRQITYVDQ